MMRMPRSRPAGPMTEVRTAPVTRRGRTGVGIRAVRRARASIRPTTGETRPGARASASDRARPTTRAGIMSNPRPSRRPRPRPGRLPRAARSVPVPSSGGNPRPGLALLSLAPRPARRVRGRPRVRSRHPHGPRRRRRQEGYVHRPAATPVEFGRSRGDRREGRQRRQPDQHGHDQHVAPGRSGEAFRAVDPVEALAHHLERRHEPVVVRLLRHGCTPCHTKINLDLSRLSG
jgi:hypothetical protein